MFESQVVIYHRHYSLVDVIRDLRHLYENKPLTSL